MNKCSVDWQCEDVSQTCIGVENLMSHLKGSNLDDLYYFRGKNIFTCLSKLRDLDGLILQPKEY